MIRTPWVHRKTHRNALQKSHCTFYDICVFVWFFTTSVHILLNIVRVLDVLGNQAGTGDTQDTPVMKSMPQRVVLEKCERTLRIVEVSLSPERIHVRTFTWFYDELRKRETRTNRSNVEVLWWSSSTNVLNSIWTSNNEFKMIKIYGEYPNLDTENAGESAKKRNKGTARLNSIS